ncbi:hypothetical protein [Spirochaeta africana]|uniref:DUF4258 domain-containing protein n=1 Tax=Spirochaeta africana (strain ATCC 700263 / DSM 8902 / Z-7692) TaxID=889378 RepID=H9UHI3_SPIAZ|nr:hypothetical protein [Spirochaeta africana]AFG36976.1 hypothetical protein Spiaf_0887 [Spirochaeta africana DSM 8902]
MKYTNYFLHMKNRPDRIGIQDEWIEKVVQYPVEEVVQLDGRIRRWAWIPEAQKYLRVILLEDGETVHNVFFDRRYRGGEA